MTVNLDNVCARLSAVSEQRLPIGNVLCGACVPEMVSHWMDVMQGHIASM